MNQSTVTVPSDEQERPETPFDPVVVEEMLRQLDKTVRAHQLYLHNNPTYLKSLELLRATFVPLWKETESLAFQVTDTTFTWCGVVVHNQPEKASDSLPWTLYKDGVREITLSPGFEAEELEAMLDIIPRVRKAQDHEDDLLTILWEQEFAHLTYRYVDVSNDPGLPVDVAAEPGRWPVTPGKEVEDPKLAIEEAKQEEAEGKPGAGSEELKKRPTASVSMEDFDSTLYFLDGEEIAYLRRETEREYATDLRRTVLSALLDIFELQGDPLVRKEVAHDLDSLTLHLLAGRQFANVAFLLREISVVLERARDLPPDVRAKLAQLPDRLSAPEALSQLLEAMDEATSLPPQEDLADLFGQLRPAALGTVLRWLGQTQNAKLRPLLEAAADRLAASNTNELVRLISSPDGSVAMEAVKRSGGLKTAAAVPALGKALADPLRELRLAVVAALLDIGTPGAMQALERALDDTDRDVRVAVVRALAQKVYKPALTRVSLLVKAREIRVADRTERLAMFELFGLLCGDSGVVYLDELLNGKGGLFARKEDPDMRACAAIALGKVATPKAQESLQRAIGEKDVVVRSAVTRALKGGSPQ
ncbi:MAG: HEAT repeat domain-containing protein [Gemmatimonadales bacterium]